MSNSRKHQRIHHHLKQKHKCSLCKVTDSYTTRLPPRRFKSVVSSQIRDMIEDDTTTHAIRKELIEILPKHKNELTDSLVRSHIKTESGILSSKELEELNRKEGGLKEEEKVAIEFEHSLFVDEADFVVVNDTHILNLNIMCAITRKGLKRLSVCVNNRQCARYFTRSLLKKYDKKGIPAQVVVIRGQFSDMAEVERLFHARLNAHQLIYYCMENKVTHPASKYIRKLIAHMPKKIKFEDINSVFEQAEAHIPQRQCEKWIRKVMKRDCV
ncbi:uncharacterized protein EV154DRAFT_560160 [Mucor mucedo]|uniref:uncharacterized protein n=1 Tax=Mucor mucedo TaxID=29922 RepID=UPI00221FF2A6|nr:uncharacterized protein EV154DRAFT_560160 [Mucor mucedo]KAI7894511.1 hypothetical protein EV154DRAFT_560160 [Mucor mucedo]